MNHLPLQQMLPFSFKEDIYITPSLAYRQTETEIIYYNYVMPVYRHNIDDKVSFYEIIAQFCLNGATMQCEIVRAFNVSPKTVSLAVKKLKDKKNRVNSKKLDRKVIKKNPVMTDEITKEAQQMLDNGIEIKEIAIKLNISINLINKSISKGVLYRAQKMENSTENRTKSQRVSRDISAPMGVAATNISARMQASIGELYFVKPEFECVYDIPNGGVLLALPALLSNGLLKFDEYFSLPKGYYSLTTFFLFISLGVTRLPLIN
jgi:hypothetical protein